MAERVGFGNLTWDGGERRTDRYGSFVLEHVTYEGKDRVAAFTDLKVLRTLVGKRVHIRCVVRAARKSGHVGDLFHQIFPSMPEVGETVDLGVGILKLADAGFNNLTSIVLEPNDGREHFWIDPRKLYRLHDQTVDLFVDETDTDFTPAPQIMSQAGSDESIDTGDNIQVKNERPGGRVAPDVERLGDGMFVMTPPGGEFGRRRKIER
jgi:hypothetical protein